MGNHFADDIILTCPTKRSLHMLPEICEVYTDEFSITFNSKLSIFLVFKGKECLAKLILVDVCL